MANIKKSFNFRNGVQVDDDNLKVSATGLVGIGTTVPTESLDVRGNLVVSGVSSAVTAQAGVLTVTTLNPSEIIGAGISVKSGIITASSGIITFFGDARFLQGMPTSQWVDVNTGLGVTSIYNTGGNVGIATINPLFTLQVGGDVNSAQTGVGINSRGDIKVSGIITASSFVGNITGDVSGDITGNVTGNLSGVVNSAGISTFGGINATGRIVGSATSNVIPFLYSNLSDLPSASTYHGAFAHVHSQGKGYFAHAGNWWELVNKEQNGTVGSGVERFNIGPVDLTTLDVSGISTFTGDVKVGSAMTLSSNGIVVGNDKDLKIGAGLTIASNTDGSHVTFFNNTAVQHILEPTVTSEVWTSEIQVSGTTVFVPQFKIHRNTGVELYYSGGGRKFATSGIGATVYGQLATTTLVASGVITATTELNSPLIGVGTAVPVNDIQVRKSGDTEIQITSDTGIAALTVGREAGLNNSNNGEFRYGGGTGAPYSTPQSLDIVNYGTHNINYYLSAANPTGVVGDFHWHKGFNTSRLMTLTNTGNLGIGETQPSTALHVNGISTVTGSSFVAASFEAGGNASIGGNLTVSGNINVSSDINANIVGDVTGNVEGNINSSGISTFNYMAVGASYYSPNAPDVGLDASSVGAFFKMIGVGTTDPGSGADFANCGNGLTDRFMILPKVTNSQRNGFSGVTAGALIYNTTTNELQVYNGTSWDKCN